jgi:tRNA threonylcarbamoyl adenosine modification protein YjeE
MSQTIWSRVEPLDRLDAVATAVREALAADARRPFCLWLVGGLGAGKTTLVGALLRGLGLPQAAPVTSPTFTYMNDYKAGTDWYAHLDLYRAGPTLSLEDLGLVDARPFAGYFVEWPESVPENPALEPTFVLAIDVEGGGAARRYSLVQKA